MVVILGSKTKLKEMWEEQYKRILRYRNRLDQKRQLIGELKAFHDSLYLDDMYACIQSIHHMKDWLISSHALSNSDVNKFIESNKELKVC
mgnify:CR=1 FL=1